MPRIGVGEATAGARTRIQLGAWVVERTIARLQTCRAILIRYDKKSQNYLVQLACVLLWTRRPHQLQCGAAL